MPISSLGVGSGLDISGLISNLMAVEQQPLLRLDNREAGIQAKISAYGAVKNAFDALQTAASGLTTSAGFAARQASIADSTVGTATAGEGATLGNYSLEVSFLAASQKLASSAFAASTTVVGTGTLSIEFGSYSGGSFTLNGDAPVLNLTIDSTNNTLEGIRDAINDANAGVTANIVNDGTGARLLLSSTETGLDYAMRITTVDDDLNDTDTSGLSALVYDASTGGTQNLSETAAAADASLKIDGLTITSSSNVLTDVIDGVTLTLKGTNAGTPTTLSVIASQAEAQGKIEAFVDAFNDAAKTVRDLSAYNAETKTAAALQGEAAMRSLYTRLSKFVSTSVEGVGTLSAIGISLQEGGSLTIDSSKLSSALSDGSAEKLFVGSDAVTGLATTINDALDEILGDDGIITARTEGLNESIKLIDSQREVLQDRLTRIQERYVKQFTALDTLIASLTQTSNFLTQQLAALPGARKASSNG